MEEAADSGGGQALDHASVAPSRSSFLSDNSAAHEGRKTQRSFSFSQSSGFLSRNSSQDIAGKFSASGFANWAKGLRITPNSAQEEPPVGDASKSPLSLFTNGFKKRSPAKIPVVDSPLESPPHSPVPQDGALGSFTKGFLDTSRNAMKAVQTKARHLVSQNKRRYQEGGFDLDMAYITENIIAMGFPAGDMSSGIFGYVEGFYRNHMEEVISFFESHHKGKYKVYNLCSERLYDASLFEGKVACFPFDDHNCPPLQLVGAFCQSAYSWLKGDLENVVVVHCKAGMARTGLMISSFLLYLKFFPTAEESISYYNQKRCVDGKGLVLPSQVRYVKYFERVLRNCDGETPIGRKVILRGFRLHKCPYWVRPSITVSNHNGILFSSKKHPRTKDMLPEDIWFNAPRKGILVFALPGERGLADLNGDFKVQFQDRHGDFYCWLNTNMMENRTMLSSMELDGFDKRRLPSPGFQVEIVILDHDASVFSKPKVEISINSTPSLQGPMLAAASRVPGKDSENSQNAEPGEQEKDDLFSDSENEDNGSKSKAHRSEKVVPGQDVKEGRTSQSITEGDAATSASGALASGLGNSIERMKISHGGDEDMPSHQVTSGRKGMDEKDHTSTFKETQGRSEGSREELAAENVRAEEHEHSFKIDSGQSNTAVPPSDFKAIAAASAADASVFTFGDEEDYESEED